jgi:YidC/Oxa1 family membrane protein insertase
MPGSRTGGFLGPIVDIVLYIIQGFYSLTHSYGLSLVLTGVFINVMLLSLNMAQLRSMKTMSMLAPVQKQLQEWYKGRQKELNQKLMELYTHLKINPLSGCLPMFFQVFIFWGIYRALISPVFAGHDFLGIKLMYPVLVSSAYAFLKPYINMQDPGIHTIAFSGKTFALYLPGLWLIALYVITSLIYQREMRKLTAAQTQSSPMMNPNFFNFFIVVISFFLPSGVMIYYIVFNVMNALEYALIAPRLKLSFSPADIEQFLASARPTARVERPTKEEPRPGPPAAETKPGPEPQPPPDAGAVRRVKGRRRR